MRETWLGCERSEKYYRVLSRARGSGLQAAKILLGLLLKRLPASGPIVMGVDETIERRPGAKIKRCYRDAACIKAASLLYQYRAHCLGLC
jgi:hypothetical protein